MTGTADALERRIRRPYNRRSIQADRSNFPAAFPATTYAVSHGRLKCLIDEAGECALALDGESIQSALMMVLTGTPSLV